MKAPLERNDSLPDERAIRSLSDQTGAPLGEVRALVAHEFARLKMGASVGGYVGVLTASNVRGMLRRKARLADVAARQLALRAEHLAVKGR